MSIESSNRYPAGTGERKFILCPARSALLESVRKTLRKSSAPHPKQDWQLRESRQRWSGWQRRLHWSNQVQKLPPTRSRRVFFFFSSTFLRATKIFSNTHSHHPAAAGKEWCLLKCTSPLCVSLSRSRLWMPSVLCDKRPLHNRASPLREWSGQLLLCVRPDAALFGAKLTPTTRLWWW